MSQSHIRVPKAAPRRRKGLEITVGIVFVLIPVFYFLARAGGWLTPDFDSTTGQVLETRIVVDHASESQSGGHIFYRLEAHVKYAIRREDQTLQSLQFEDRWLIASEVTATRELLTMVQSKQSRTCEVYWRPGHSEAARCRFS